MSSDEKKTVNVTILDKPYQVALPSGEHVALTASARHLDEHMRAIRKGGKVVGLERIAVMAALNITNDLLKQDVEEEANNRYNDHSINRLSSKVDEAIARFQSGS
ncbi:MAG: cell division protein ZapA [Chitinophagales bacterium]|jgi:cell division protein ZapA|tara:strand:+ start:11600 stop:11914 length:315 start_codon:yes stop_codon:yes gene_type:complete